MKKYYIISLAIIAILVANVKALGFDFKKMSRLLATVDPKTCNCIDEQLCRIEIPYDYTSVLDINCQTSLKFCCNPRKIIKAFVSPKDMSEFVEAAKRLNVASASQIQTMMVNADPTKVEATLEVLKTADDELIKDVGQEKEPIINAQDNENQCKCLSPSDCPKDKIEYTFGKSCEIGTVRCCITTSTSTSTTSTTSTTTSTTTARRTITTSTTPRRRIQYKGPSVIRLQNPTVLKMNPQQIAERISQSSRPVYIAEPEQGTAQIRMTPSQSKFHINNFHDNHQYIGDRNDFNNINADQQFQNPHKKIIDPRLHAQNLRRIAQEREMYRRRFQPTLWERVKDILNPLNPFA